MRKLKPLRVDLSGRVFGRLTVIAQVAERTTRGEVLWDCACECGNSYRIITGGLTKGGSKSCGCLKKERSALGNPKHGMRWDPSVRSEYQVWLSMRRRCSNPKDVGFKNYGGRGILVCSEWNDFPRFLADMGSRPSRNHTIERLDNNLGYSPENCVWATRTQNARNRRSTKRVTFRGEERPLAEWCDILRSEPGSAGISYQNANGRLHRGWSVEDALTRPLCI